MSHVIVDARGLSIKIPSKRFGQALSRAAATSEGGKANPAIAQAIASARATRSGSRMNRDQASLHAIAQDHPYSKWEDGGIDDIKKVLGLPYIKSIQDKADRNRFTGVAIAARAKGGPLKPSAEYPGLLEGEWVVGKSNGSDLRSIVQLALTGTAYGSKPAISLKRGARVGLRASVSKGDPYAVHLTVFPDLDKRLPPVHTIIGQDEGVYASGLNPAMLEEGHARPFPSAR